MFVGGVKVSTVFILLCGHTVTWSGGQDLLIEQKTNISRVVRVTVQAQP